MKRHNTFGAEFLISSSTITRSSPPPTHHHFNHWKMEIKITEALRASG
ncbi:hypothetical protein DDB_G0280719 [Dictyostelium discoideum AX4]|nr:hypothetical protein DDB_G0280719 [Dictyostelium discoideum AX4]EAL67161.1 hypothetical protein DDB_G0280719 [Dictyostelium discoideum AX4]|eukprot:XP_641141.1 hypothetical protein DDB_G0280719 [Dictyostelium discoideum AX4]